MELLWGECPSSGNDPSAILSVQVHAVDGAIVLDWIPHVGPVDVTGFGIHHDPIGDWAHSSYDDLLVRTVGFHRKNATTASVQKIQEANRGFAARRGAFCFRNCRYRHTCLLFLLVLFFLHVPVKRS